MTDLPIQVGKYLVSPFTRRLGGGRYVASVSIRSGSGSASHDRVLRLMPEFDSPEEALRYATAQGLEWLGLRAPASGELSARRPGPAATRGTAAAGA